jgi:hypothetical protein
MTFVVESLAPAHAVIQVTHTGTVTASDMRAAAKEIKALSDGEGALHILSDFSGVTQLPGAMELLNLMDALQQGGVNSEFRQALVWPKDAQARIALDVWRTAESNRGIASKAFGDRDAAIAWLDAPSVDGPGRGRSAV